MKPIKIKFPYPVHFPQHFLSRVELVLEEKKPRGLLGANGIGKTSFISFLKHHKKDFFSSLEVTFLDQLPLAPLGQVRPIDLFSMLANLFPKRIINTDLAKYPLIERFDFGQKLKTPIKSLSGGENQILKLLAAFYVRSDLFVLDEPSNHLDQKRIQVLINLINEIAIEDRFFLIVDHQKNFLLKVCSQFSVLSPIVNSDNCCELQLESKSLNEVEQEYFAQMAGPIYAQ